jgi:hypothetical protein
MIFSFTAVVSVVLESNRFFSLFWKPFQENTLNLYTHILTYVLISFWRYLDLAQGWKICLLLLLLILLSNWYIHNLCFSWYKQFYCLYQQFYCWYKQFYCLYISRIHLLYSKFKIYPFINLENICCQSIFFIPVVFIFIPHFNHLRYKVYTFKIYSSFLYSWYLSCFKLQIIFIITSFEVSFNF